MFKRILTSSIIAVVGLVGMFGVSGNAMAADPFGVPVATQADINNTSTTLTQIATKTNSADSYNTGTPTPQTGTGGTSEQEMMRSIVNGLNLALDLFTIVVTPAIILASWLMSPDWTTGDLFNLRPVLHDMWVMISNITYFIYAVLLIFIALATIFNSEHYGYKALLPRLALGIILVPLTWWFVQFIISMATIVTASVINIPAETLAKNIANEQKADPWWGKPSIPIENAFSQKPATTEEKGNTCTVAGQCLSPKQFIGNAGGMYSNLMLYSFAVFKFQDVKKLDKPTPGVDTIYSIVQIVHQGLIGAIFFLIYGLLVLALLSVLMMRAIKLWAYAIFSPLFTLRFVLGDGFKKFGGDDDMFSPTEFIGLAFSPAVIGITLSFGLVIVSTLMSASTQPAGTPAKETTCTQTAHKACTLTMFGNSKNSIESWDDEKVSITKVSFGGVSWTFQGDVSSNTTQKAVGALRGAGGIIGTIIIDIIALIFIWVAFMAGTKTSKAVSKAVEPFQRMGESVGKFGASMPKYIPIPGTGGQSAASLAKTVEIGTNKLTTDKERKIQDKAGKLVPWAVQGIFSADDKAWFTRTLKEQKDNNTKAGAEKDLAIGGQMTTKGEANGMNYDAMQDLTAKYKANKANYGEAIRLNNNLQDSQKKALTRFLENDQTMSSTEKEIAWKALATFNKSATTINVTSTMDANTAVSKIMTDHNNKISKDDLTKELKEIYKDKDDRDDLIKEILEKLKNQSFQFK